MPPSSAMSVAPVPLMRGKRDKYIPTATMRCLECQDNYCDGCVKVYQFLKISRYHKLVKIGRDAEVPGIRRVQSVKYCSVHSLNHWNTIALNAGKSSACVSCFVERHKLHDCVKNL